jgi:hypothetical protein
VAGALCLAAAAMALAISRQQKPVATALAKAA